MGYDGGGPRLHSVLVDGSMRDQRLFRLRMDDSQLEIKKMLIKEVVGGILGFVRFVRIRWR